MLKTSKTQLKQNTSHYNSTYRLVLTKITPLLFNPLPFSIQSLADSFSSGIPNITKKLDSHIDQQLSNLVSILSDAYLKSAYFSSKEVASLILTKSPLSDARAAITLNSDSKKFIAFNNKLLSRLSGTFSEQQKKLMRSILRAEIIKGTSPYNTAKILKSHLSLTSPAVSQLNSMESSLRAGNISSISHLFQGIPFSTSSLQSQLKASPRLPSSTIDAILLSKQNQLRRRRARTVARTESIALANGASHSVWETAIENETLEKNNIRRFWYPRTDEKVRPAHINIPSLNPNGRAIDEAFLTPLGPLLFPGDPNGTAKNCINCRCQILISYSSDSSQHSNPISLY